MLRQSYRMPFSGYAKGRRARLPAPWRVAFWLGRRWRNADGTKRRG